MESEKLKFVAELVNPMKTRLGCGQRFVLAADVVIVADFFQLVEDEFQVEFPRRVGLVAVRCLHNLHMSYVIAELPQAVDDITANHLQMKQVQHQFYVPAPNGFDGVDGEIKIVKKITGHGVVVDGFDYSDDAFSFEMTGGVLQVR